MSRRQGIRYFFVEDESSRVLTQVPKSLEYLETLELPGRTRVSQ